MGADRKICAHIYLAHRMPVYALLRQRLAAKLGQKVTVTYGRHQETVIVLSVDAEGFLCRTVPQNATEEEAEFWLAFKDVTHLDTSSNTPLVS